MQHPHDRRGARHVFTAGAAGCLILAACGSDTAASARKVAEVAFRDAVNAPPADWTGPIFELSHDFPTELPAGDVRQNAPWLQRDVDFSSSAPKWQDGYDDYLSDILAYVRRGQDEGLADGEGWRVEIEGSTRWFHVPWMAYDQKTGREFVHGLTAERVAQLEDLIGGKAHAPSMFSKAAKVDQGGFETWAFGCYNDYGGYALGRAIPPSGVPQTVKADPAPLPAGLPFAEGTLVMKLLFTTASDAEVPFLKGASRWTANRHVKAGGTAREPAPVHLVQMDVAVVDHRSPTNWVYGTFAYDGTRSGESVWDRLSPLGLQWGADSATFPAVPREQSVPARQSVLAPIDIYEHDGPEKRLDGPVDNPESSCMACHNGAFAAPVGTVGKMGENVPPIFDFTGMGTEFNEQNAFYFGSRKFPEPYGDPKYAGTIPLDTSLQLLVAYNSYAAFVNSLAAPK